EIHEGPADGLTRSMKSEFRELPVILVHRPVMAGCDDLIEPVTVPVEPGRTLEPCEKKAAEHPALPICFSAWRSPGTRVQRACRPPGPLPSPVAGRHPLRVSGPGAAGPPGQGRCP